MHPVLRFGEVDLSSGAEWYGGVQSVCVGCDRFPPTNQLHRCNVVLWSWLLWVSRGGCVGTSCGE